MAPALRKLGIVPALALLLGACDTPFGYYDDIEGYYAYGGTVDDSPGYTVNGELRITRHYGDRAEGTLDWYMYEGGDRILDIVSDDVLIDVDEDGTVHFDIRGDIQLSSGRWTDFHLEHDGRVSGRTMRGNWRLRTDIPSDDEGRFTASR